MMEKKMLLGNEINLLDNSLDKVISYCIIPEGKFYERDFFGDKYKIGYNKSDLEKMLENYSKKVLHYDLIVNLGHSDNKVGNIEKIYFKDDVMPGLYMDFVLDEDGKDLIESGKYNFMSAEVYNNYLDVEGNDVGKVFAGAALTNYPRHKKVSKIKFSEVMDFFKELFDNEDKIEEGEKMDSKLTEEFAEVKKQNEELTVFIEKLKKEKEEYASKLSVLEGEKNKAVVEKWSAEMLLKGYLPANVEKFSGKLLNGKITFEEATEFISLTPTMSTEQIINESKFSERKTKLTEEEEGIKLAKEYKNGGVK